MTLGSVRSRILAAADRSGRDPGTVRLIAVSKEQSPEAVMRVYDQGHRDFGESRAQELAEKIGLLPGDIRWHFVGRLQRNKVRLVRPSVVLLHSMDRMSLGEAWVKGPGLPPPVLMQVNVGMEPQKGGVPPEDAAGTLARLRSMGLRVRGLMGIPPPGSQDTARRYFRELAELRLRLAVDEPDLVELSMGMTDDFEAAIAEGSTMVRVGRAIFGPRKG